MDGFESTSVLGWSFWRCLWRSFESADVLRVVTVVEMEHSKLRYKSMEHLEDEKIGNEGGFIGYKPHY